MKRYNLSEIMKSAHTMRKFRPEKYPTFSEALKKAWKVAKFNKEIADRRAETIRIPRSKETRSAGTSRPRCSYRIRDSRPYRNGSRSCKA